MDELWYMLYLFNPAGMARIFRQQLRRPYTLICALLLAIPPMAQAQPQSSSKDGPEKKKVLFVVTSHGTKGSTGEATGYYLSEVAHPWAVLVDAGYEIDFVSPKGGKSPVDGYKMDDATNQRFVNSADWDRINRSMRPEEVKISDYVAIHYAGGHGTMWDFAQTEALAELGAGIYEQGGAVSAVCHGPSGLVNLRLSNGEYLVAGKRVSAFTNEEEAAVGLTEVVPYLLESSLRERGAIIEKSGNWQKQVSVDGRLVTGQNPASAHQLGLELAKVLEQLSVTAQ